MRSEVITEQDIALMRAMQERYEREGGFYTGEPATGKIERLDLRLSLPKASVPAPPRRESRPRPRGRRFRRRARAPTRADPDEPPLAVIPPAEFRRDVDAWLGAA